MNKKLTTWLTAITLFAAVTIPVRLDAQSHTHYVLVDIGIFGGSSSSIPFLADIINNRGMVVGKARTANPDPNNPSNFIEHAFQWQNGILSDLGALSGGNNSFAEAINASGMAVGTSENGVFEPGIGSQQNVAVVWNNGKILNLGTLGGNQSGAIAINNRGQVTGWALDAIPDPFSLVGPETQTRAFLWQNGSMRDLGTLGGPDSFGQYVNELGQVAGFSYTSSIPDSSTGIPTIHPFLWQHDRMLDLGSFGGTFGQVNALNNRGQVIGDMTLPGDISQHAFLWDRGHLTDLSIPQPTGTMVVANRIDDSGAIAGGLRRSLGTGSLHAALWKNGVLTDLGTLEGDCSSLAWGSNSKNQVVGISASCDRNTLRAFLWENGSMIDLNTRIPSSSKLRLVYAMDINDRGEIAGLGVPPGVSTRDSERLGHAFVLIPSEWDDTDDLDSPIQNSAPKLVTQNPITTIQDDLGDKEMMTPARARLVRRHR